MAPCFPSLMLFLACCPPPETVPDDELQQECPEQYLPMRHDRPECCGGRDVDSSLWLRKQLPALGLGAGAQGFQNAGPEDRQLVVEFLERFVLDFDFRSTAAWRILVLATIHDIGIRTDAWKARWVEGRANAAEQLREALDVSRRTGRAFLRLEAFQQFLIAAKAVEEFKTYSDVGPEEVRPTFSGPLEWYQASNANRNFLAFDAIPQLQEFLHPRPAVNTSASPVVLLVLSLGAWAKTGFVTLWSLLKHRSMPLRVFVLGDAAGLADWREALQELGEGPGRVRLLTVSFEYIDLASSQGFQQLKEVYPSACAVTSIGWALLARVVCHEFLPKYVDKVIALDLGDVLVLDDVRHLWALFNDFQEHHIFAAAYVAALHHVNGGIVLYHVGRMRERRFTDLVLRAAKDGSTRSGDCIHDQSILNTLHVHRAEHGDVGPSPMMLLPCRWNVIPIAEWQMQWNSAEMWLPEIVQHLRYPGFIAADHVEVYCPDAVDVLSPWAFLVLTQNVRRRLRRTALDEASRRQRYCVPGTHQCCQCGERASAVHIPGDLKQWPFVATWLGFHRPPWKHPPTVGMESAETRRFWHGSQGFERDKEFMIKDASLMAEAFGSQVCFDQGRRNCCTFQTKRVDSLHEEIHYQTVNLSPLRLPLRFEVETTAPWDAHLVIGMGAADAVEVALGAGGGRYTTVRWLSAGSAAALGGRRAAPQQGLGAAPARARFSVAVDEEGRLEIQHADLQQGRMVNWGLYLPGPLLEGLRQGPVHFYAGTPPEMLASWVVCQATNAPKKSAAQESFGEP